MTTQTLTQVSSGVTPARALCAAPRLDWPQTNRSASWLFNNRDELLRTGHAQLFLRSSFERGDSNGPDPSSRIDSSVSPAALARARMDLAAAERRKALDPVARDLNPLPHFLEAALARLEAADVPAATRVFHEICQIRQRLTDGLFNSRPVFAEQFEQLRQVLGSE